MTAKYSKLPLDDQDRAPVFDFTSVHNYGYPKYFSYGGNKQSTGKYKSAFTYSGINMEEPNIIESGEAGTLVKVCAYVIIILCYIGIFLTLPFSALLAIKMVQQHERYVIFRLGKLLNAKGPGLIIILPCIDKWSKVDLRMKAFSVPPQLILTSDSGGVEVGAEVYYRIKDPVQSVKSVQCLTQSCRITAQTALLTHVIKFTLANLENERKRVEEVILNEINDMVSKWGVEVSKVELSQMKILQQPQAQSSDNPLSVLGSILFPPGNTNNPLQQLTQTGLPQVGGSQPTGAQAGPEAILAALGLLPGGQSLAAQGTTRPGTSQLTNPSTTLNTTGDGFADVAIDGPSGSTTPNRLEGMATADDLVRAVTGKLNEKLVHEFGYIYKFLVTGNNGGIYYLDLKNGSGDVGQGAPPAGESDVTITLTSEVLKELLSGQQSAFNAYMCGSLKVDGDITAGRQLDRLLDAL